MKLLHVTAVTHLLLPPTLTLHMQVEIRKYELLLTVLLAIQPMYVHGLLRDYCAYITFAIPAN